ncbi:MAG TPA: ABC transporter ATP-binding protein [Erythrobacter sp.]|jgi:branched-chain amino acid transport system ATP-binding protein|nr:ABC transporter ATP-binding protein [Erythrobacter sp.]
MSDSVLIVEGLSRNFGGVQAVNDVNLTVPAGQMRAVIGPNGAGKSTFFNLLTGYIPCNSGRILFRGKDVTGMPPHSLCRLGLGRTFQINSIFASATVLQNAQVALFAHRRRIWNMWAAADKLFVREAEALLATLGLEDRAGKLGSELSYGDRRRLEVALALACEPQLLLLDEPTAGMSIADKPGMVELIRKVSRERGVTVVLIEHDMDVVFSVADEITVLHQGAVVAQGTPQEIKANEQVQQIYLGEDAHA